MLKRILLGVSGLALVVFFLPPPPPAEPVREGRLVLGTLVTVKLYGDAETVRLPVERAYAELDRVDSLMSRYRDDGALRRLEQSAQKGVQTPAELAAVLARSQRFAALTGGAFDCTVGALSGLWNFPDALAPPDSAAVDSALALVGYEGLQVEGEIVRIGRPGTRLDLGAAAKGYAVDRMVAVFEEAGIAGGLIDAGGDIRYWGAKPDGRPWVFGVQHPRDPKRYIEVDDLGLAAIATSGDYQQYFEWEGARYHHLLDPRTGYPARACVSATVWAG
ncbi:FAD:protein FMN transferase, partial [bacterium]|nr:FAD:protein FMN transferase [bacterium]